MFDCCSLMTLPSSSDSVAGIGMAPGIVLVVMDDLGRHAG